MPTEHGREKLTNREKQVLILVANGCTTKEVAARLNISFKTAATHRYHLMEKLGVHGAVHLARYAIRHGLIQP